MLLTVHELLALVTRQMTLPTSSATSKLLSGPTVTQNDKFKHKMNGLLLAEKEKLNTIFKLDLKDNSK